MVRAIIIGRLGNQFFQYAHAKKIAEQYNKELHLYFYRINNLLKDYKIDDYVEDKKLNIPIIQCMWLFIFLVLRKIICNNDRVKQQKFERKLNKWLNNRGIIFNTVGYYPTNKIKKKNILIAGYFESELYFKEIKENIMKKFVPRKNKDKDLKDVYQLVEKTNSIAVSIRRGDFVELNNVVCSLEYYKKAIEYINKNIKNPRYFIFSDDIEWVKQNMNFPKNSWYENNDVPSYENVRIRSMCKHFILANSTFSWWGAYLSNNKNKIVIVPKYWRFTNAEINITLDDWIKIENK